MQRSANTGPWSVRLLDQASVRGQGGAETLERKTAALLAILAIDGPTTRARLAGLLWPDSDEERARANLRQTLSRLRKLLGSDVVEAGDPVRLAAGVEVDLCKLRDEALAGAIPDASLPGTFLVGLDFSDCDELVSWIEGASTSLRRLLVSGLEAEAERLEGTDRPADAIGPAQRIVDHDPYSERAHRRLIRLHYLAGDRAAALRSFERCRRLLVEELGVEPDVETRALARLVERGSLPSPTRPAHEIPPSVRRPPRIVGRDRQWARMQTAWDEGKLIFVSGPAGMGKSRIARDFVAAQGGPMVLLESRPGDASVPFASQARAMRKVFATFPGLEPPTWVRRELSRMVPELLEEGEAPPPPLDEVGKVRFYQAQVEMLLMVSNPHLTIFVDDLQFCDPASAEIGHFMFSSPAATGADRSVRSVVTFRSNQLGPALRRAMEEMTAAGIAEVIELGPLETGSVGDLLGDLEIGAPKSLAGELSRAASGNPALVLELVKSLIQDGALEEGLQARGSLPARLDQLFRARFEHLSPLAMRLAQVAGAAGERLKPALAAAILEVSAVELGPPWRELEEAQILHEGRFVHDLLQEAVLAELPAPVLAHLHASIAAWLERNGADGTSIALHWHAAGEPDRAAPYLIAFEPGAARQA